MDRIAQCCEFIKRVISESPCCVAGSSSPDVETEFICDDVKGQYVLLNAGWRDDHRAFHPIIYVRIKNDKIWIEEDETEYGITDDLMRAGVPKEDTVLAFHSPEMRPYTDFAVA